MCRCVLASIYGSSTSSCNTWVIEGHSVSGWGVRAKVSVSTVHFQIIACLKEVPTGAR